MERQHAAARAAVGQLAVRGGPRALDRLEGTPAPKIGIEEFMALAEVWGFSHAARERIRRAVADEDLGEGPWLLRYHHPGTSRVDRLEALARQVLEVPYALAVHSGTSALETALAACGVGPGMEVIVPGHTFLATATAVVHARAVPVVCEIDQSLTIDASDLERKITPRTRAVIPVHMLGAPADMDAVAAVATRHDLAIVEDAAQAMGARFQGRRLGTFGDAGCFSLNSFKVIGGGEGGLVVTGAESVYARALNYHDTAASYRDSYPTSWSDEVRCGTNVRMSELEGAVDLVQLGKLDAIIARYRERKRALLAGLVRHEHVTPQTVHDEDGEIGRSLGFFVPSADACTTVVGALVAEGVPARRYDVGVGSREGHAYVGWRPVLEQRGVTADGCPWRCPIAPAAAAAVDSRNALPRTLDLLGRVVLIDLAPWWTDGDCARVAAAICKVLGAFYRPTGEPWGT